MVKLWAQKQCEDRHSTAPIPASILQKCLDSEGSDSFEKEKMVICEYLTWKKELEGNLAAVFSYQNRAYRGDLNRCFSVESQVGTDKNCSDKISYWTKEKMFPGKVGKYCNGD